MSDAEILELLGSQRTKEQGFRLLMASYQERLYWHVRRMVVTHEDADDVLQNTFIKIYKGIDRFKGKSKLYTWMYRIASNEAITFLHNRRRRKAVSIEDEELNLGSMLTADVFFDGSEAQAKLVEAVEKLPRKQKLVFNMKYYDDMSYQDISEIVDTSIGALKASYHHAVKKIESYLKQAAV